jgi:hypothetical protein
MHHLGGARRQFFNHFAAGAAQQDRFESFAQMVQIFVAQQLASFVHHLVAVEEPERRSQAPLVDELHYGVKFIQPVFQRRAGEHQCKCRFKPLDDATGFGFPVLDALSFVQDDQIPGHRFYSQNIPQHLLIIAYGKKMLAGVLCRPVFMASQDHLALCSSICKAVRLGRDARMAQRAFTMPSQKSPLAQYFCWIQVSSPQHTSLCLRFETQIRRDLEPKSVF